ncbi:hypothetical protein K437DRAFT_274882 [Tilletiaria anomala UBC 951]|uniref:Uncharacterized protein n=1 Tax=Tilletiaria anomala (strain ATCC 24038 / CBS 436.72 / UBC 951) TaxID=1037660 RepID=A0A066VPN5_TILAU|nr:uncharacterized protein K437DRAFT_274882 [Tilletiaria anomala UBC 951]KDN43406.1 hypothetical protein K437DRAFT_274882 [Tilletiaria anomala UBC 951]
MGGHQPRKRARLAAAGTLATASSSSLQESDDAVAAPKPSIAMLSKQIRTLVIRTLLPCLQTLDSELFLLHRIHYKHGVQFNSAKWYSGVEAVRRCSGRVVPQHDLGKRPGKRRGQKQTEAYKSYEYGTGGSSILSLKEASAEKDSQRQFVLHKCTARVVLRDVLAAYNSMWASDNAGSGAGPMPSTNAAAVTKPNEHGRESAVGCSSRTGTKRKKPSRGGKAGESVSAATMHLIPTKQSTAPRSHPSSPRAAAACESLLKLSLLLTKLLHTCQAAFKTLSTHLNTPPAPTFAPLVLTLIAVVASIHDAASVALCGSNVTHAGRASDKGARASQPLESADSGGLIRVYADLRLICVPPAPIPGAVGGRTSARAHEVELNLSDFVSTRRSWPPWTRSVAADKLETHLSANLPMRITLSSNILDITSGKGWSGPRSTSSKQALPLEPHLLGHSEGHTIGLLGLAAADEGMDTSCRDVDVGVPLTRAVIKGDGAGADLDIGVPISVEDFGELV